MVIFHHYKIKKLFYNKPLRILLATNSMILVAGAMLGPIYALFVEKIGGDLLDASLASAAFAFAAGITVLMSANFSDKIRRSERIIILGYLLMGVGFLLYTIVNSMFFLLIVQVLIGFGEAIYNPPFDALYSKHIDDGKEGREWGAWESMNYFSVALGAVVGGFIASTFGFNILFVSMATLCFVSAFYIYLLPKRVL